MFHERVDSALLVAAKIDFQPPLLAFGGFEVQGNQEPLCLLGANATGKSSLSLALTGAVPEAYWADVELDFRVQSNGETVAFPSSCRFVQVVPQRWEHSNLGFCVEDELKISGWYDVGWAQYVFERLELNRLSHCEPAFLSSGEQKRLMIAMGLAARPPVLVLDEWPIHLDVKWQRACEALFEEFRQRGGLQIELSSQIGNGIERNWRPFIGKRIDPNGGEAKRAALSEVLGATMSRVPIRECTESSVHDDFHYSRRHGRKVVLRAQGGQLVEINGENGSGKSTLLREIWGCSGGCKGILRELGGKARTRGRVHLVLADPIFQVLGPTIGEELLPFVEPESVRREVEHELGEHLQRDILTLSSGERKLLALAAAAYGPASILALDEPLAGLDDAAQELARRYVESCVQAGKLVVVAAQDSTFTNATMRIGLERGCEHYLG